MWIIYVGVPLLLVLVIACFLLIRARLNRPGFCSIVMLRNEYRPLSEVELRGAYRRAYSSEPQIDHPPPPDEFADAWLLTSDNMPPIAVLSVRKPYMSEDEAREVARRMESKPGRAAITEHRAWISVDGMGSEGLSKKDAAIIHVMLARLAAEFYDDGCTLVYLKEAGQIALPGPTVEQMLHDGKLVELFGDADLHAPMYQVPADDEQIAAAMAEAKRRLPEFIRAFEERDRGVTRPFLFKARFKTGSDADGTNEYIWLLLHELTDTGLRGTIENAPIDPAIPAKGTMVAVPLDDVVDWIYAGEDKKPVGMFVDRELRASKPGRR